MIERDYSVFSGIILERWFKVKYIKSCSYTNIGGFWDRKGEHEIDLIAVNEIDKTIEFCEIKRNPSKINLKELEQKGAYFLQNTNECKGYSVSYKGLSLNDL